MTSNNLSRCYYIAAKVVAEFGDTYLPVFERLHNEIQKHQEKSDIKSLALRVAEEID